MVTTISLRAQAVFISPAALIGAAVVLPPFLYVLFTSFHGLNFSTVAFQQTVTSTLFQQSLVRTLYIAGLSSLLSLVLGFSVALHLAKQPARRRTFLLILVLLPFWTSVLVKCFSFTIILGREGIVNSILSYLSGSKVEIPLIFNLAGTLIGMTNYLVPLAVLPILASLVAIDPTLYRAASVMGAKPARIFWTVTVPLSLPGVFAALLSIFVMSLGAFIIPALLGGPRDMMLSNLVDFYNRQILDWPKAAAISVMLFAMVIVVAVPLGLLRRQKLQGI